MTQFLEIKDIITFATPLIKAVVDTFVTPKLETFRNKNQNIDNNSIPTTEQFQEYFFRTFKKLSVLNTLVFRKDQVYLEDVYIPLTLLYEKNGQLKKFKVTEYPQQISDDYNNILIVDSAGMGKSTLMKKIFIDSFIKNEGIPLFIELRRLSKEKKIIDEIKDQLDSINKKFNTEFLYELLAGGNFIFILDGYDEISLKEKEVVTLDIQDFIYKTSSNRFFMTSRPENSLASFGNFKEFKIKPLEKKEAYELLRKYDKSGKTATLLIEKLQEQNMTSVIEFLINPLLTTLLYLAFEYKQKIPFKKHIFYRQVFDANFEAHDLTKGESYTHDKYSKLEIDDFHRVLRCIGFECFKNQRLEFTKDEILNLIDKSKKFCVGLDFNNSDFLNDLLKTVPLFIEDGNYYKWAHKSLQEYFTAQFIYLDTKEKQKELLLKMFNSENVEKFTNIFDLYYDMDYKTFRNTIEYEVLKEYNVFQQENYIQDYEGITTDQIIERKQITFYNNCFLFPEINNLSIKEIERRLGSEYEVSVVTFRKKIVNVFAGNKKAGLLKIIVSKDDDLSYPYLYDRYDDNLILEFAEFLKQDSDFVKISDSKNLIFNTVDYFAHVTEYLYEAFEGEVIHHFNALEKLKKIETDLLDSSNDIILDYI